MAHELPELPYAKNGLEPHISQETLEYHYGKHHKTYVDTTNKLIEGTEYANLGLEDLVKKAKKDGQRKLFNQSAQVWNHTFYWYCMSPKGGGEPTGQLAKAIESAWGSADKFREDFTAQTTGNFGSGWGWLVQKSDGGLAIVETDDAETPLTDESVNVLLACDIWEHAYYIDYRNRRPDYMKAFWSLVSWDYVASKMK